MMFSMALGLDPVQWGMLGVELIGNITLIKFVTWLLLGEGWKFILRWLGFDLDILLVNVIARVYDYFLQLLNGDLFNDAVLNALLKNVYVFIGIIMFFRLFMLIIKYLINPDLVSDQKIGVNALIKRVIIGLIGILFIPTIFDYALELQGHILEDNIIQKIIIPADMLDAVADRQSEGGKYIGTYVLAGFISPGENASSKTKNEYENALANGDLSTLSTLRKDGFLGLGEYEYDYFYFLSTFVLCYVLWRMINYALDILVRFLRMLIYQLLAPVAMIEYMINGSEDGVFKSWKTGILSTYFMLFVRVLALWFVVLITILMSSDKNYTYVKGSLLASDDYLLRAFIIIAVIGFMQDLPKLLGQVFGLDFDQESSATGTLKQVAGMAKGVAMGALALGGTAVGAAVSTGKSIGGTFAGAKMFKNKQTGQMESMKDKVGAKLSEKANQSKLLNKLSQSERMNALATSAQENNLSGNVKEAKKGLFAAAMGTNSITGAIYNGYNSQNQAHQNSNTSKAADAKEAAKAEKEAIKEAKEATRREEDVLRNITERVQETKNCATPQELKANVIAQRFGVPDVMVDNIQGRLDSITASGQSVDIPTATQEIKQVLGEHFDVSTGEVEQIVKQVVKDPTNVSQEEVQQIVNQVVGNRVAASEETIDQVVNQVYGTRVNNSVDNATQVISQKLDQQIDIQRNISDNVTESVNIQRKINDTVHESVEIQKDIKLNTEEMNVYTELIAENTEKSKNTLDEMNNKS